MKAWLKRRTSMGFREALRLVRFEWRMQRRHQRGLRAARGLSGPLKVQLGCGPHHKEGWVNIDAFDAAADLQLDLREDLPFPDGSVTIIYSEHFFEHLEYPRDVKHLLSEARRVLVPGGTFSVGVPRIERALEAYAGQEWEWFAQMRAIHHPEWCTTPAHQINYLFRQAGEHKYAYDFETLSAVLADAGFTDITERRWDAALDSETRKNSLYVDAVSPG